MTTKFNDEFIDHVIAIMKRKEITKIELAKRLGISKSTLSNYLLKYRGLPYETAILIAKELSIDITKLHELKRYPLNEDEYAIYRKFKELFDEASKK